MIPHQASPSVDRFLAAVREEPCALVLQGEAGIGKTTLWRAALEKAASLGFEVLSARAAAAESVLAYSALSVLMEKLGKDVFAGLPVPQTVALDRVLLRAEDDGPGTDQRAVAAGFVSVLEHLAGQTGVLVAIDDLQWLDPPSARIIASAARRVTGAVGFLATLRTSPDMRSDAVDLPLRRSDRLFRVDVEPMSIGALHRLLQDRLGRSFSRPKMTEIFTVSAGNPFYAIELARAMGDQQSTSATRLPTNLTQLVRTRIESLPADTREVLLAAACLPEPTVTLVADATEMPESRVRHLLEETNEKGITELVGDTVRFSHPLLTKGVYADASNAHRRGMHRRLARIIDEPELKARHLALAAVTADAQTLAALDSAAESARARGAPAAAAELCELAIGLGGETAQRRIRSAGHHFAAGDTAHARELLRNIIAELEPGRLRAEAASLLGFVHLFDDGFLEAADVLAAAIEEAADDLALRTTLLISLSYARYNAGQFGSATRSIEEAVTCAERLGSASPISQALSMRTTLRFLKGDGLDDESMRRAVELDDPDAEMPMGFRPRMQNAMLLGWAGTLDRAHVELAQIRHRCIERGEENELMFVAVHSVLVEIWRADLGEARRIADDTMERALQLGGNVPEFVAMTLHATVEAHRGHEDSARSAVASALDASQRCGANLLVVWPITTLGFLEVSLGNYEAALSALAPLRLSLEMAPRATEIPAASFIPDAVEALIALGRVDEAEPMVAALETNGERLDRPWMVAVAARCRAMLLAAQGDVTRALQKAEQAIDVHARVPMPFELARTQLVLGQLQRRQRRRELASETLRTAMAAFEAIGTPLWAERVRAELQRASGVRARLELTASERRVAELAATGSTNREMAAALFISPKTVEANLSRIYRKLNIRSRAELGRAMRDADVGGEE
ncbi:AAA ATPase domain-containing protein [Mycolicibacterium rutilum]|uniref:AAA ATPase domain-containing protein n=1 Tax=Mycolicibacterium rutilum TaxID=370526 RepID=A0A1H6IUT6_MYCRU|nr:LuxR family transcriptional regulator [Mycolicibacterium rutilum]SEH50311.1 AAA ATPase domain-containing protein [Mycolicibacterium rutilum]